jgi:hypothetical protein
VDVLCTRLLVGENDTPERGAAHGWRKIPISNNVGAVKHNAYTRVLALEEERHFALFEDCQPT